MKKIILLLTAITGMTWSCDFLDPKLSNERSLEDLYETPNSIRGLLTDAYLSIPSGPNAFGTEFLDAATANAVTNNVTSSINRMATGIWQVAGNPLDNWSLSFQKIASVNSFLDIGLDPEIRYIRSDEARNDTLKLRLEGEAYFLRAYHQFELLKRFGGKDASGSLLGYPIITEPIQIDNIPVLSRNTYAECVKQIVEDFDRSMDFLPEVYTGDDIEYGINNVGRPTSVAARALKSRMLLYAASPIYNETNNVQLWSDAAQAAGEAIGLMGSSLPDVYVLKGGDYDHYYNDGKNDELIMRRLGGNNSSFEGVNFPPSMFGDGRANPSQNLVDAFSMANGYPVDHPSSGYDPANPYDNRDPRFYMTILYNNASFRNGTLETFEGGADTPGAQGVTSENSTRSGYYLRKWISAKADRDPANINNARHYFTIIRKGEVFLNFAEAAYEAFGPNGDPLGLGMTAVQALGEVRRRAGVTQPDQYLAEAATDDNLFRALIRNERRIELCFEGHYFFDVRRWNADLNEPVQGMKITRNGEDFEYEKFTIYTPNFEDHMRYGPLPFGETLKTPSIVQNDGW